MQQQDLQKAAQTFEEELKKELQEALYPDFPEKVSNYVHSALRHESLATLGCGLQTFRDVLAGKTDLYTVSFLLNALQARTAIELGMNMNLEEYADFQEVVSDTAAKWNGYVQPMKEHLQKRIMAQQKLSQGVPAGKIVRVPGKA
jgi:hypothetical protein